MQRKLNVFLCHAVEDKPDVRKLHERLKSIAWIAPWIDDENLLPGQNVDIVIDDFIHKSDVVIVCLSKLSVSKEGRAQKEIKRAIDVSGIPTLKRGHEAHCFAS